MYAHGKAGMAYTFLQKWLNKSSPCLEWNIPARSILPKLIIPQQILAIKQRNNIIIIRFIRSVCVCA